jgi:drug/metabolite transporter (DMT)-like permease
MEPDILDCEHIESALPPQQVSKSRLSLAAAVATMFAWGVNFAFVKHVLDNLGVEAFMFLRFVVLPLLGFAMLLLVFRSKVARTWPRREDLPRFIACGLLGHAFHISVVMYGMHLSTPFSSSLVLTSGPLFTLIMLAALGVERLRLRQVAGTVVALAGIILFLSDKFAGGLSRAGQGDLVLLFAAALFALYTVLVQPIAQRYGPLIVFCYTLLFSAPPVLIWTLPAFLATPASVYTPSVLTGLAWALVVSSFLGWLMWTWVNTVRGVARAAPFAYLTPPFAGIVAWLTLGESFTWLKIGGALVTMAGVAYAQFGSGPPPREAAQPDPA